MEIPIEIAKNETQSLVNLVKNEARYLCCFNSHVQEYEQEKDMLNAKLEDVNRIIDRARGVSNVTSVALQWKRKAEELIAADVDTKKEKCFNDLCLNCWRQYRKGRELAKRTLDIKRLLQRHNFDIVAGSTNLPGIKYRCLPNFMPFESRKSALQDLKKALEDEESNMIGLYGLGGTGKTSMATQVGAELEGSTFAIVIFLVVSKPPDFKKLRGEIAKHLKLEEEACQDKILNKINALEEKLLMVLDDVWEKFDLTKELGIPPRHLHQGCVVLITTRNKDICTEMDCQRNIHLDTLTHKEALSLFLEHTNNSSNSESLEPKIVEHCHGVPVVIVAVARSLKDRPHKVWVEALTNLERGKSILEVREDLKNVYEGLKLSYDNLKNEKAKKLFLISSLFPEDFEIPIEVLIRIGVGMGPFGEVDDYIERRRKALDAIVELLDSSLLLNAERECVKMHDLIHEVALLIGQKDIQSVIESELPVKKGLQCLFWKNDDFPKHFDGGNLEILIIFLHGLEDLKVPDTLLTEMTKLNVLILWNEGDSRIPAPSLFPTIQSLQDIRTLKVVNLELCSISLLGKLPNLETLWLDACSIIKLPGENFELEKLRFLRVAYCKIKMSNPFEFIEACPQLEELTFLRNKHDVEKEEDTICQKISFHTLQIYQITCGECSTYCFERYGSMSRFFQPGNLVHLISEETFKQLARTAKLLSLQGYRDAKQKNLIPEIVSLEDRGTTDLIVLDLFYWPGMQCLIDATNNRIDVNALSNLVHLSLYRMGLSNILFNDNYNLCHLKIMRLVECPKLTSIFHPSTAQSLLHLVELIIEECDALECIIEDKSSRGEIIAGGDDGNNDQKSYATVFEKLKILEIKRCGSLEIILPIFPHGGHLESVTIYACEKLKYIFDKFQEVNVKIPSNMEMKLSGLPSLDGIFREYKTSFSSPLQQPASTASGDNLKMIVPSSKRQRCICWGKVCCFKTKATSESEESNDAVPKGTWLDQGIPQGSLAPTFVRQLALHVRRIWKMELKYLSLDSVSTLFTLSMASMILWEELTIYSYDGLKHLVTSEEDDYKDQINCSSIFPKLQKLEIWWCKDLEFLFLSTISIEIKNLKSLSIIDAPKLTYVVGKYQHHHCIFNQNQNDELHFNLPALENLSFGGLLEFISISPVNCKTVPPSAQEVRSDEGQLKSNTTKELDASTYGVSPFNVVQSLLVQSLKNVREIVLAECGNLMTLSTLCIGASTIWLENLTISRCHKLKCITTHEGDAQVNKNYDSIFPRLEQLHIAECDELECLFLSTISCRLEKLKSLTITKVPQLKYVVGKYQHVQHLSNQNQKDDQLHFHLPALETLYIVDAPMINSICAKNYNPMPACRKYYFVGNCGIKSFIDCNVVNLRTTQAIGMHLEVCLCEIEEILNLTHTDIEKNGDGLEPLTSGLQVLELRFLRELVNICVGPKRIIRFHSLQQLIIFDCKKLKVIFSASIVPSLPMLKELNISNCEELVHIVEEDYETNVGAHLCHEPCFPNLKEVFVEECDKLKYLFSISINDILPKLTYLTIRQAYELEHVLIKRGMMEDLVVKDVLPQLSHLNLKKLPNLVSVCHGIDFQILKDSLWTDAQYFQILKKDYYANVRDCPHFSFYENSSTQNQRGSETADSEVEEKAEEEPSSHLSTEQSLNMGEATQQSLTKDELVDQAVRYARIKIDPQQSAMGKHNFTKGELVDKEVKKETNMMEAKSQEEMARHDIQFHEEEEEEEDKEGGLITTQHHRSDIKAKISLLKEKPETPIHGDSNVPFTMRILSEQASKATLPLSPISSKASIGLDPTPQATLCKPTIDDDIQVSDKSHATVIGNVASTPQASSLHKGVNEKDIKETNVTQDESKANSSEHVAVARAKEDESDQHSTTSFEGVFNMDIKEANSSENKRVEPSNLTQREQESSFSKDSQPRREMPTSPFVTISQDESSKIVEVRAEDGASILETSHPSSVKSKKEPINVSPNPTVLPRSPGTPKNNFQKVEEGGSMSTHRPQSDVKATNSLLVGKEHKTSSHGEPFVPPMPIISSEQQASNTILPLSPIPSKTPMSPKQIPVSTPFESTNRRNNVQENVGTTNQPLHETLDAIQISSQLAECGSSNMASSIFDINDALSVPGVKDMVDMMKLEGVEPVLLAQAFKTNPQLHLSSKDRSTKLLCYSYRVLLNILNILATKSPFTIIEAEKTLLAEYLKDASFLGFDKDWIESIRIRFSINVMY